MLLARCCKCQTADPGYSGQSGAASGGGGSSGPSGSVGGCDICPTVPTNLTATLTMNFTCPCSYSGTYNLQHRAGTVFGTDYFAGIPVGAVVCDAWLSDTKAKNDGTCVLSGAVPRIDVVLYVYLGNYSWRMTIYYTGGFTNRTAYFDSGEDGTNCFTTRSSTAFTYSAFFPCTVTSASFTPA